MTMDTPEEMLERRRLNHVRTVLYQWGRCETRVNDILEQQRIALARLNELDREIGGAAPMDGQPRNTIPGDPVFRAYLAREHMKEVFAEEIETCEGELQKIRAFQRSIGALVAALEPVERDVINCRYVKGADWAYVGYKLHMDESTARRFDRSACRKLEKKLIF